MASPSIEVIAAAPHGQIRSFAITEWQTGFLSRQFGTEASEARTLWQQEIRQNISDLMQAANDAAPEHRVMAAVLIEDQRRWATLDGDSYSDSFVRQEPNIIVPTHLAPILPPFDIELRFKPDQIEVGLYEVSKRLGNTNYRIGRGMVARDLLSARPISGAMAFEQAKAQGLDDKQAQEQIFVRQQSGKFEDSNWYTHLKSHWETFARVGDKNKFFIEAEERNRAAAHVSATQYVDFLLAGFALGTEFAKRATTIISTAFPHPDNPMPSLLMQARPKR